MRHEKMSPTLAWTPKMSPEPGGEGKLFIPLPIPKDDSPIARS
jgi:hypothetical protein